MITFVHVFAFVIVLLILLMLLAEASEKKKEVSGGEVVGGEVPTEKFDTTYQHDAFAADAMRTKLDEELHLQTKYNWAVRDPMGYNVYDVGYVNQVRDRNDYPEYFLKSLGGGDNDYDLKFSTTGDNDMECYDVKEYIRMQEPQITAEFRGEKITLPQAYRW